jgi:hypothetical protein
MIETRTLESSLPGVIPHVAVASLVRADGNTQVTLCRALGRNRVALVAKRDLPVGEEVQFEIDVEGGMVRGSGRVERMHAGTTIDGSAEPWVVVDIEEMERGSVPRLLRLIFRDHYLDYTAAQAAHHRGDAGAAPHAASVAGEAEGPGRQAQAPPAHLALRRAGRVRPLAPALTIFRQP